MRRRCGAFELIERATVGGMAEVFLACPADAGVDAPVYALKWALPHVSGSQDTALSFVDESRIARSLEHPNVCRVHGYGSEDDRFFIVMEYIRGKSLRRIQRRADELGETIPLELVAYILGKIGAALDHAHLRHDKAGAPLNIIHRDINPNNIMVTYDAVPKLIDFGIARAEKRSVHTGIGLIKGQSAYMSPEQARGEALDGRSDIFALGIVLYEFACGRKPYNGATEAEQLIAAANASCDEPRAIVPDLQRPVERILQRAMSQDLDQRYPRARDVAGDLLAYAAAQTGGAAEVQLAALMERLFHEDRVFDEARIHQLLAQA